MSAQRADRGDGDYEMPIAAPASAGQALFQLDQFLPYRINVLANLISLALSRVYSRRYRIGVPEWRVLVVLGEYGVMNGMPSMAAPLETLMMQPCPRSNILGSASRVSNIEAMRFV